MVWYECVLFNLLNFSSNAFQVYLQKFKTRKRIFWHLKSLFLPVLCWFWPFFGMGLILAFYQLFSLCRHHLLLLQKSWMVMSKLLTNSTKIKVVSSIWTLSWLSTIQWPILQVFSPREKWICIDSSLTWKWMGQRLECNA